MLRVDDTGGTPRILVVEDEAIIANDLKRQLERLDYEVVGIADNGRDALAMASEARPSLVFMDIIIQGPLDGIRTADELSRRVDVPIVFLTAHSDAATVRRARQVRPYGYLVKPFDERDLHTTVEMALYRHRSEAKARLLMKAVATATVGMAVVDARDLEQRFMMANPAFEKMSGYSEEALCRRSPWQLEGPCTDVAASAELRQALAEGRDARVSYAVQRDDGTPWWTELSMSVLRNAVGDPTHFLFVYNDITARKEAEAALLRAQKMEAIGQLTGGVAHDFNNILGVILSFAGFVRDDLPDDDPRQEDIVEVLRAADKAVALTRQLLTFSRQVPAEKRPIDLNASLGHLIKMLRRTVGEAVQIEIVPSARPAVVKMDPVQLDQVLLNLAVNARDAMPGGGRLRFAVSHPDEAPSGLEPGSYVRLTASDTGDGMDADTLGRIFEPFFTTKPIGKGTGLGLATCAAIIKDAGGRIDVDSAPGAGTTFTIDLPACGEPVEDALETVSDDVRGNGEKVLVVDDDLALRKAAARILTSADYEVMLARDGEDAIRRLDAARGDIDLVVSDVVMPRGSGYAVADHIRRQWPSTRVLLTSGYMDGRVEASGAARTPLLWKPFTRGSLLRAVRHALRAVRSHTPPDDPPGAATALPDTVLVIEDHANTRNAVERLLARAGYRVVAVGTFAAARAAFDEEARYAAIVCDLTLPDGSGAGLVYWLRDAHPDLARRVIIHTGGATDELGHQLLAERSGEMIRKPAKPEQLLEAVRRVGAS